MKRVNTPSNPKGGDVKKPRLAALKSGYSSSTAVQSSTAVPSLATVQSSDTVQSSTAVQSSDTVQSLATSSNHLSPGLFATPTANLPFVPSSANLSTIELYIPHANETPFRAHVETLVKANWVEGKEELFKHVNMLNLVKFNSDYFSPSSTHSSTNLPSDSSPADLPIVELYITRTSGTLSLARVAAFTKAYWIENGLNRHEYIDLREIVKFNPVYFSEAFNEADKLLKDDSAFATRSSPELPAPDLRFKTANVTATKGTSFKDYGLSRNLMKGISEKGWEVPSPVQEATLEVVLEGQDVLARAENGSEKAGAYCIPCIQKIDVKLKAIQALIVVPTYESVLQTSQICDELSKYLGIGILGTADNADLEEDLKFLKEEVVHLVIGTPDRILELIGKDVAKMKHCKIIVLDEADKLLSQDSESVLDQLIAHLPMERQVVLFSATFTNEASNFAINHLSRPFEYNLKEAKSLDEMRVVAEYFEAERNIIADIKRELPGNNLSYYLYAVVKKTDNLKRSDVCWGGVTCSAYDRWRQLRQGHREFSNKTHRMLIVFKCTPDSLPVGFISTHCYSRVLERSLYTFADDFSLIKGAKAGDGGFEDHNNQNLVTPVHIDFVAQRLNQALANPRYMTFDDRRAFYPCSMCKQPFRSSQILTSHRKFCTGTQAKTSDDALTDLGAIDRGLERPLETPKRPPNNRGLVLYYETVRDEISWSNACAQWKKLSDDEKRPFMEQFHRELAQFYKDAGDQPNKKRKVEGAPKKPLNAYQLWMDDGNRERLMGLDKPEDANGGWVNKTGGQEWRALSEEDQQPYIDQAKKLKDEYKKVVAELMEQEDDANLSETEEGD